MTNEEQKKYIEGYVRGLMEGAPSDLYVENRMHERNGEFVIPLDTEASTTLCRQIGSLYEKINDMLEGEEIPYSASFRFELVFTPIEISQE